MDDGIDCLQRAGIASTLRVAPTARDITALIALLLFAFNRGGGSAVPGSMEAQPLAGPGGGTLAAPAAGRRRPVANDRSSDPKELPGGADRVENGQFSLWSEAPMVKPKRISSGPEDIREGEVREVREHERGCVLAGNGHASSGARE